MKYICETCKKEHNGLYGSGRFCSSKCAKSFSTKEKRSLINDKIRKKRKLNSHSDVVNICKKCGKKFKIRWNKRHQKYCSRSCSSKNISLEARKAISKKMLGKNSGEKNGMYGKSPKNTKLIKVYSEKHTGKKQFNVRSSYEKIYIDDINKNNEILKFTYEPENFKIKYKDEKGNNRTYQPDFLINDNKVVEIKNSWNVTLNETKLKEIAFKEKFPLIIYEIIFW